MGCYGAINFWLIWGVLTFMKKCILTWKITI